MHQFLHSRAVCNKIQRCIRFCVLGPLCFLVYASLQNAHIHKCMDTHSHIYTHPGVDPILHSVQVKSLRGQAIGLKHGLSKNYVNKIRPWDIRNLAINLEFAVIEVTSGSELV